MCFRNWGKSSMEMDIISEGFKRAGRDHGVGYIRFIGDSSAFPTLIAEVQGWRDPSKRWSVQTMPVNVTGQILKS